MEKRNLAKSENVFTHSSEGDKEKENGRAVNATRNGNAANTGVNDVYKQYIRTAQV